MLTLTILYFIVGIICFMFIRFFMQLYGEIITKKGWVILFIVILIAWPAFVALAAEEYYRNE